MCEWWAQQKGGMEVLVEWSSASGQHMASISELCCSFEDESSSIAIIFQAKQHLIIVIMLSNTYGRCIPKVTCISLDYEI